MFPTRISGWLMVSVGLFGYGLPVPRAVGQESTPPAASTEASPDDPISVTFTNAPIRDVLFTFAEFSDRSFVAGREVEGTVSAEIRGQPWETALRTILHAHGMVARELKTGIILVESARGLLEREAIAPLEARAFAAKYVDVGELQQLIGPMLTERGQASVGLRTNTLLVTDLPRILDTVEGLVESIDVPVQQVDISAKIIFINRTALDAFGITYDLKDIGGNQLNILTPGVADLDGDGIISLPDEQVNRGTDVISLGGNSLAALGNATDRISNPTLSLLTSLVIGRTTLIGFIDALESAQLTDVEAKPSVRVLDSRTARVVVGEETPVRVLDAGAQLQAGSGGEARGAFPVATVDYKETGVILEVAPRITRNGDILLNLSAERSSADLAPSDVGFVFRRQKAESEVLVKDGETVVIGGLTVTQSAEVKSGIPLLMDIPLLGRLFRTHRESSVQRDLLIMVTPTIVAPASP